MRACLLLALLLLAPVEAFAQSISLDLGGDGSLRNTSIQLIALITLLSLAPGLAIMITCFPFLITVLSILRQAIGLQQSPPNMLLISLALFLTYFIMEPVFLDAWTNGIQPYAENQLGLEEALTRAMDPFRVFMVNRLDPEVFYSILDLRDQAPNTDLSPASPLSVIIPSFLLSEISRAFEIGFLIYLPFLVIDLVVAAVLMSMGMMMVPPAIVSLPFKLAFFVVSDGWTLIAFSLVRGYQ